MLYMLDILDMLYMLDILYMLYMLYMHACLLVVLLDI